MTVPGLPGGSHAASGVYDNISLCCKEAAQMGVDFRICPECRLSILRCPVCRGAVTPLGNCERCIQLQVGVPAKVALEQGARFEVPVELHNAGSAAVGVDAVVLRTGDDERRQSLGGRTLSPGERMTVQVPFSFPQHGEYGLTAQFEIHWPLAESLVLQAPFAQVFRIRPRRDGPLIQVQADGTGNLVNIDAATQAMAQDRAHGDLGPEGWQSAPLRPHADPQREGFGDGGLVVTWRSRLILPDLLLGNAPVELVQDLGQGMVLGRNRPPETATSALTPSYGVLRYPPHREGYREHSQGISRAHWRIQAAGGAWCLEQLGQRPTLLLPPKKSAIELRSGQRHRLAEGTRIRACCDQREALTFVLRHREVRKHHVLRSELQLEG